MADELPIRHSAHRFIGRTIKAVREEACNLIQIDFEDGGSVVLHVECNSIGLPSVLTCTDCTVTAEDRNGEAELDDAL